MSHRTINHYLIREITGIFVLGLFIFTLVLLMGRMLKLMEMVVANGVPFSEVLHLIVLLLPSFLVLTIPMAFLLAVLLAFGRLSSDNEITVLKASGFSLESLLPPVLWAAAVAAMLTLFISLVAVPWGNTGFKRMTVEVARKYAASAIKERIFRDDLPGIVLYLDQYDESSRTMQKIMIQDSRNPDKQLTIFAKSGMVSSDDTTGILRIVLRNGSIHSQNKQDYRLISFQEYLLTVDPGEAIFPLRTELDMNIKELITGIRAEQLVPQLRLKMATELHSRFAFPFATFVFAILAVPLGLSNRRSGKGAGFTISILIILSYYILLSFLRTMAEKGQIQPYLAIWLPNLVFLSAGILLFRMASLEISFKYFWGRLLKPKGSV